MLARSGLGALWWAIRHLDTIVDLEVHSKLTTVFSTLTMVVNRLAFVDAHTYWRSRLYTHTLYFNMHSSVYCYYDGIASLLGIGKIDLRDQTMHLERLLEEASLDVRLPAKFIAIGVGCSDLRRERQMAVESWRAVLERIRELLPEVDFVLVGGPQDREVAEQIAAGDTHILDLCGSLPLIGSMKVLSEAYGYIGIDSMLLHVSRLLCERVQSIWGPTHPDTLRRPLAICEDVQYRQVLCSPCVHVAWTPPCHGDNICIAGLRSEAFADFWRCPESYEASPEYPRRVEYWASFPEKPTSRKVVLKVECSDRV